MDDLTSEVQNTQQIIGNLALDALGMRPSPRAERELKSLVKTFPLLIWEFKAHIKDAVYFFYDRFEPENGNHVNPNAFPESCRESDESDCQSRTRKSIVEDVSWQFGQIIRSHERSITHEDTRTIEDMFFYIFYRHLGVRRRDRSPNRPRLKLQGKLLENKLLRDQEEREARVLNGLKQRLAMRPSQGTFLNSRLKSSEKRWFLMKRSVFQNHLSVFLISSFSMNCLQLMVFVSYPSNGFVRLKIHQPSLRFRTLYPSSNESIATWFLIVSYQEQLIYTRIGTVISCISKVFWE